MDTSPDPALDRITDLARMSLGAPIALISLVDDTRQWFKSRQGLAACQTDRGQAFCAHALPLPPGALLVVPDATHDHRFNRNPLVTSAPSIRFYAGAVLTSPEGANLGTLCVIDDRPREGLTDLEQRTLRALADLTMNELEVRRAHRRDAAKLDLLELAETMSGVGRWRLDVATGVVDWSNEVYRIHGVDRTTFDPKLDSALDFYDAEGREAVVRHLADAVRSQTGFSFNLRLRRRDGDWRQVICKATCELNAQGEVTAISGVFQDVTEHVDLLRQVSDDRERYRLLAENATDVIATYRPDGTFTFLSPAVARLLGRTPDDLLGRRTFEVIDPRDHARVTQEFGALVTGGEQSARIEYRAVGAKGETIWLEAHPTPIRNAAGRLTGFQDVVRDITARRAAQDAATEATAFAQGALARAQASEARYRLLAENANDMIATTSMDSTILFTTPAVERLLGYAPEEVVGRKTLDLTHPDDAARVVAFFEGLVAKGPNADVTPYQFRGRHKDGRWVWLEGQPRVQFDARGRPRIFQDVVRDVGERKRAEEEALAAAAAAEAARMRAAQSEARYRLLAENATDVIGRYATDGTLLYISPACREVLGFRPEEMLGRRALDLIHPEDLARIREQFADYVSAPPDTPPIHTEYRVMRADGRAIWLEGRPRLVRDALGQPTEYHDVMRDITARKALELELEEARIASEAAAQAKADFLANMSHELRTPLTSIIGYTSLASEQIELAPLTREYVRRVQTASRALLATVNDILDFSKLEAGQVELRDAPTDVMAVCRDALELFMPQAAAKDLRLEVTAAQGDPPPLLIDAERLLQLLLNLVGNAVKFTARGSVVVSTSYAGGRLTLEVRDTGPGIAAEAQPRLFKRFSQIDGSSTRGHGGTGLGLAICKGLAERMGGTIRLESELGQGSTFSLELPATQTTAKPKTFLPAPAVQQLEALRVLVVDDNIANRELARIILAGAGAEVAEAASGGHALEVLSEQPFDAVLLDLRMPDLDGAAVLQRLRRAGGLNDATPVIAYTADASPLHAPRAAPPGFDGIVGKPVSPADLLSTVRAAIDCGEYKHEMAHVRR